MAGSVQVLFKVPNDLVGTTPDSDSGLIAHGVAVAGKLTLGSNYLLRNLNDAAALGITKEYDRDNGVLLYYHIKEFFRMTRFTGARLFLKVVANTETLVTLADKDTADGAVDLINFAQGAIKQIAFAPNYAETVATGGNVQITADGDNGDTITITVLVNGTTVTLAEYTKAASETSEAEVATAIRALVNEGTATHGFTAAGSTDNVALTAPNGYGDTITTVTAAVTGNATASKTDFSSGELPTYTSLNGMNADSYNAIAKAQGLADWSFEQQMPLMVCLPGIDFSGSASSCADLTALSAPDVALFVGQDYNKMNERPVWNKNVSIGTMLGAIAQTSNLETGVGTSIQWAQEFGLTATTTGDFTKVAYSDHVALDALDTAPDTATLRAKGYLFCVKYPNVAGYFFSGQQTCNAQSEDEQGNLSVFCISYSRTKNKAARSGYAALIPKVASPVAVNADGTLPTNAIKAFEGAAQFRAEKDLSGQISNIKFTVDPTSNLITGEKKLLANFDVQPLGSADKIQVTLALKSQIAA